MFTWEEFKEDKVAVHCKTEEEAKKFCKMMHEQGLKWDSGESYLENPKWSECKEETCYSLRYYGRYRYYSADQYFIYEFEEIGGKNMEFTKKDLKDGMVVQYRGNGVKDSVISEMDLRRLVLKNSFINKMGGLVNTVDQYNDDLQHYVETLDIVKVFKVKDGFVGKLGNAFSVKNLDLIWERKEPIKLDDFEKEFLNRLLKGGFKWIARDEDGKLFAYSEKPFKKNNYMWDVFSAENAMDLELFDTFDFVKNMDEEPTDIEKLLKEVE